MTPEQMECEIDVLHSKIDDLEKQNKNLNKRNQVIEDQNDELIDNLYDAHNSLEEFITEITETSKNLLDSASRIDLENTLKERDTMKID